MVHERLDPDLQPQDLARDTTLEQRFAVLWRRCLLACANSDPASVWTELIQHYSEPRRHYHGQHHLAHCLGQFDLARESIADPDQVEMAIWFHDVIVDPRRDDNEQRSADYFRSLADASFDPAFVDAVTDLILVTTHRGAPEDPDHQFICDIDLASFGSRWECFLRDSSAVKAEFGGTTEAYYRRKKAFLQSMLARPKIFLTTFFNQRYEQQSRKNILRLLDLIKHRSD